MYKVDKNFPCLLSKYQRVYERFEYIPGAQKNGSLNFSELMKKRYKNILFKIYIDSSDHMSIV